MTMPERVDVKGDLFMAVLGEPQDLIAAISRLEEFLQG